MDPKPTAHLINGLDLSNCHWPAIRATIRTGDRYASVRAIESPSSLDDQQWLTFPVWPYLKLLFCMWLVLPIFNGAAYIYGNWVRRYLKIGGFNANPGYPESYRRALQMMSLDARKSVERFIETHGIDAFDKVVNAVSACMHGLS
ncbi:hypothetical protein ACLOJK_008630 [Asimina triloba]